jgi:FkbM family methyltransferase
MAETLAYRREAIGWRSFLRLMRVRLSQSKVGWLVCPKPIVVDVDLRSLGPGVRLRSHTTDISVLDELIVSQGYDPVLPYLDRPARTIVDLGSNTGLATRWMAARWPDATIACVEPERGNLEVLRHNVDRLSATVFPACVGAYERKVQLTSETGEHGFSMSDPASGLGGDVDVITFDRVLADSGLADRSIDLLKCDIEGAEVELFESCEEWIPLVSAMVVECHGAFDGPKLVDVLARNGAEFDLVERMPNPAFGCEVVELRRSRGATTWSSGSSTASPTPSEAPAWGPRR